MAGLGGWSLGLGPVRDDNQGHLRTGGPLGTGAEMRPVEHRRQGLSSTGALALGYVSLSHQRVSVNLLLLLSVVSTGPSGLWENRSPESALRKGNTKRAIAWTIGRRVESRLPEIWMPRHSLLCCRLVSFGFRNYQNSPARAWRIRGSLP